MLWVIDVTKDAPICSNMYVMERLNGSVFQTNKNDIYLTVALEISLLKYYIKRSPGFHILMFIIYIYIYIYIYIDR